MNDCYSPESINDELRLNKPDVIGVGGAYRRLLQNTIYLKCFESLPKEHAASKITESYGADGKKYELHLKHAHNSQYNLEHRYACF